MNQAGRAADLVAQHLVDAHARSADQHRPDRILIALQSGLDIQHDIAQLILADLQIEIFLKQNGDQPGNPEGLFIFRFDITGQSIGMSTFIAQPKQRGPHVNQQAVIERVVMRQIDVENVADNGDDLADKFLQLVVIFPQHLAAVGAVAAVDQLGAQDLD